MKLINVTKRFASHTVINNLNLSLQDKKITAILGASGVGKTTLIRVLAGTIDYEGCVEGRPERIACLFQEPRLLPHLTAEQNLQYALSGAVKDKAERKSIAAEALFKVGLEGEGEKYPKELSGGMAQRVGIARAFQIKSDLLLMDEPFKELDFVLKKQMIDLFWQLFCAEPTTTVFVTHDPDEAIRLADRIILLSDGASIAFDKTIDIPQENRTEVDIAALKESLFSFVKFTLCK